MIVAGKEVVHAEFKKPGDVHLFDGARYYHRTGPARSNDDSITTIKLFIAYEKIIKAPLLDTEVRPRKPRPTLSL